MLAAQVGKRHVSIALSALKSLYISHLISPTRFLLSVKQLKAVQEFKDKVSDSLRHSCFSHLSCLF